MKKYLLVLILIGAIFLIACEKPNPKMDAFADCLTNNNVKMYGAYWCPHCIDAKKSFGNSFERINYIECSLPGRKGQTEFCKKAGIEGYLTREINGIREIAGPVSHEILSSKTGCPLP